MKLNLIAAAMVFTAGYSAWAANDLVQKEAVRMFPPTLSGTVVDAKTKQPLSYAVVQVAWVMRAEADKSKKGTKKTRRLFVKQIHSGAGGRFDLPNWKPIGSVPEWKPLPGQDPIVRIYAKGYQRLVLENTVKGKDDKRVPVNPPDALERKWMGEGVTQALRPLPNTEAALAKELTLWKKDLESEVALSPAPEREAAIRTQEKLLVLFDELCNTLSAPKRSGLCYASDSELGRYLAQAKANRAKYLIVEEPDGQIRKIPLQAIQRLPVIMPPIRPWVNSSPDSSEPQGYIGIPRPGVPPTPAEKR